jgi:hypothetical protein
MCRVNDIVLNQQIVANEERGPGIVGVNAAYPRRRHDDGFRPLALKKTVNVGLRSQIQFRVRPQHQVGVAPLLKRPDDCGTHQSTVACNVNFGGLS